MHAAVLLRTQTFRACMITCGIFVVGFLTAGQAAAQQFELATPDGLNRSQATIGRSGLLITDAAGQTTVYDRERRYDTADGLYEGYISRAIGRVVRWPSAGRGAMQLADLNDPNPRFRISQMAVTPLARGPGIGGPGIGGPALGGPILGGPILGGPILGGPGQGRTQGFGSFKPLIVNIPVAGVGGPARGAAGPPGRGRLTTEDAIVSGLVLQAETNLPVRMVPAGASAGQYWVILPVTRDVVRLQLVSGGTLWSLSATRPAGPVVLTTSQRDTAQLWRAVDAHGVLRFDSLAYPGRSLAGGADGVVQLERTSDGEAQHWLASFDAPPPSLPLPTVRLAQHELRSRPAIPPANVRLVNSHSSAVTVIIRDVRSGRTEQTLRIPAGQSVRAQLQRDPGGVIVERYEVQTPGGFLTSDETITPIPAAQWYDISVYEQYLTSIAIDRTGKSPNVIEDINYQRKGVGSFPLPAGEQLSDGDTIDVWQQAKAMQNPGGLPALRQDHSGARQRDPLQRTLQELGVPQR